MTLTRKKPRTWLCPLCGHRNELRTSSRKCQNPACGEQSKPAKRVPKHARILQGKTYPLFVQAARDIHGVTDESCCVCGKPRSQDRPHDRDHGHRKGQPDYGKARGLACPGDSGCNKLMLPWITAATARGIADAKRAAGESDAERWALVAAYLERVEAHYREA